MIKASIVIPCYNEEKDIGNCLSSLEKQSFKDFEVIVVDDGSTDKTKEIVKKFKKVRLLEGKHKGPGFSRNLGSKKAKGDVLVFIDSDMEFDRNYLKNLVSPILKNKKIIGTTHETELVKNMGNIWSKCWGRIRVSKDNAQEVKIFRAIRKDKFLKLGMFDPKYGYADDQTFWFKYRIKPNVAKNTVCYHQNPDNLKEVYEQSRWIGASIDNKVLNIALIKYFMTFLMVAFSPIAIPLLSLRKSYNINNFGILFPWMVVFITFRYFGTIEGMFRNFYLNTNIR